MQGDVVLVGDEFERKVRDVARSIRTLLGNVNGSAFMMKERAYVTTRQQTLSSVNMRDPVSQLLYNVILDHCVKAERVGPGSFLHVLDIVTETLLAVSPTDPVSLESLKPGSFRPSWDETKSYVTRLLDDTFLAELLLQALDISGVEGRIFVERATGDVSSVERLNGFNFHANFPSGFSGVKQNVKCVVIDGFIESVSEVNRLFQHVSDSKETLLLVCRALADDVTHTIKVNAARKTLDVIPVTVKYDFEGLNVLNDIAIVCETDVVSSMKGQLISMIDVADLTTVPLVMVRDGTLTIVNDKAIPRARLQAAQLMEKRAESKLEQFQTIFDDRVKSLTAGSVRVRISGDRNLSDYIEKLDVVLRVIRSTLRHGFFSTARMRTQNASLKRFADPIPFDTVLSTFQFSTTCLRTLQGLGCVVRA